MVYLLDLFYLFDHVRTEIIMIKKETCFLMFDSRLFQIRKQI
jgi:hypothetical protein